MNILIWFFCVCVVLSTLGRSLSLYPQCTSLPLSLNVCVTSAGESLLFSSIFKMAKIVRCQLVSFRDTRI